MPEAKAATKVKSSGTFEERVIAHGGRRNVSLVYETNGRIWFWHPKQQRMKCYKISMGGVSYEMELSAPEFEKEILNIEQAISAAVNVKEGEETPVAVG